MIAEITPACSRVKVINHVTGSTTILKTRRDRSSLWFDLARLVRCLNRSRRASVNASLHVLSDVIVLQLHTYRRLNDLAKQKEVVESIDRDMLHYVETLVFWKGGQQA